MAMERRNYK